MTERWIIDAMNVIGSRPDGWWKNRRTAIIGLIARLENWAETQDRSVTVVLEQPMSPPIGSELIEIAQAPRAAADSADDEIFRRVQADANPRDLTVVTSDGVLSERVRSAGASVYPAARFRRLIDPE